MDLAVIYENIERLLKAKKLSGNKVSNLAGKPDAIRNIKRKLAGEIQGQGVTVEVLSAIARVLDTTVDDLKRPHERITIQPQLGLKQQILDKLKWLDQERSRALQELEALEEAEIIAQKPLRKKYR